MESEIADLLKDGFSDVEIDFEQLDTESQILQAMDDDMNYDAGELRKTSNPERVILPNTDNGLVDDTFVEKNEETSEEKDKDDMHDNYDFFSHEINTSDDQLEENMTEELDRMADECIEEEGSLQADQVTGVSMLKCVSGVGTITAEHRIEEKAITLSLDSVDDLEDSEDQLLMEHASYVTSYEIQTPEETSSGSEEDEPTEDSHRNQSSQSKPDMYVPFVDLSSHMSDECHAKDDLREFTEEDQEQVEESLADYPSDLFHSESDECNETNGGHLSSLIGTDFSNNRSTTGIDDFPTAEEMHDQEILINDATEDNTEIHEMENEAISQDEFDQMDEIISEKDFVQDEDISKEDMQDFQANDNIPEEKTSNEKNTFQVNVTDHWADPGSNTSQEETGIISESQTKDANTLIKEMLSSSELFIDEDNLHLDTYNWNLTEEEFNINLENEEDLENLEMQKESERDWELDKARIDAFYKFFGDLDETEDQINRNHKVRFDLDYKSFEYEEDSDSSDETEEEPSEPVSTIKSEYHSESDEPQEKPSCLEKSKPKEQQHGSTAMKKSLTKNRCLSVLKSVLALSLVAGIGLVSFWWATEHLDWTHWMY